jgi:D-tyrosyl-tRNA(Tyr) deacylase
MLVQRTCQAAVVVDGEVLGKIDRGLLVLLGVRKGDGEDDVRYLTQKLLDLRVFDDPEGRMNLSLRETGGELLVISQFTLYGDCRKGRRPSFDQAERPEKAEPLYHRCIEILRQQGVHTEGGRFGARMQVHLVNDGPVTLMLESERES